MKILVYSKDTIEKLLTNSIYKHRFENSLFISINCWTHYDGQYAERNPIPAEFQDKTCYLWFDDQVNSSVFDNLLKRDKIKEAPKWKNKEYYLFNEKLADKIINFLNANIKETTESIVIHCTAGISRSGAIGIALNDFYNKFLENNPQDWNWFNHSGHEKALDPNPLVKAILYRKLGMSYDGYEKIDE